MNLVISLTAAHVAFIAGIDATEYLVSLTISSKDKKQSWFTWWSEYLFGRCCWETSAMTIEVDDDDDVDDITTMMTHNWWGLNNITRTCSTVFIAMLWYRRIELKDNFDKRNNRYREFSRRPCWRAETMKQFYMKIQGRKCIVFALQHGGNDVTWKCSINCLHLTIAKCLASKEKIFDTWILIIVITKWIYNYENK